MRQIGRYTVDDTPIGSGGMGQVLRGWTPQGQIVAIKEILPEFCADPEFRYRITCEVGVLRKLLDKPGVVNFYESFELNHHMYIVMELVEGQTLEQLVSTLGPFTVNQACKYMIRILEAMQSVHEQGIVHRDIKPGNVMIRPDDQVCILDFGVSRNQSDTAAGGHTIPGTVIGTDGYMSPEQANGMTIDHRTDIYSLACLFFYMLTGHHAYVCDGNEVKMMMDIVNKPFPRLKDHVSDIPSEIQKIMDRASDKNMMKRYQSCREFGLDLKQYINPGTHIDAPTATSEISVSIGREGCDICTATDNYRVSRHHADVTFKLFTGGRYYVYRDCSSNGTTIDGTPLKRGMTYNIPEGCNPVILLANDAKSRLDWSEVTAMVNSRIPDMKAGTSADMADKDAKAPSEKSGFFGRLKKMFSH